VPVIRTVSSRRRSSAAQRPSAKELLKHRFIRTAKKSSYLTELIVRLERWRDEGGRSREAEDDEDDEDECAPAPQLTVPCLSKCVHSLDEDDPAWDFGTVRHALRAATVRKASALPPGAAPSDRDTLGRRFAPDTLGRRSGSAHPTPAVDASSQKALADAHRQNGIASFDYARSTPPPPSRLDFGQPKALSAPPPPPTTFETVRLARLPVVEAADGRVGSPMSGKATHLPPLQHEVEDGDASPPMATDGVEGVEPGSILETVVLPVVDSVRRSNWV
jgi:serine/threonine-protein kinase 24/25/MST4